jgi:hypothetical protein
VWPYTAGATALRLVQRFLVPEPLFLGARLAVGVAGRLVRAPQLVDPVEKIVADALELGRAQQPAGGGSRRGLDVPGQRLERGQLALELRDLAAQAATGPTLLLRVSWGRRGG